MSMPSTRAVIVSVLETLCANYGRGYERYGKPLEELWYAKLRRYSAKELARAAVKWCESFDFMPTIAKFEQQVQLETRRTAEQITEAHLDCDSTGWREVAHHVMVDKKIRVHVYAAACDCTRGQALLPRSEPKAGQGRVYDWRQLVDGLKMEHGTVAVYWTHEGHTALDPHERYDADTLERLAARKPNPSVRSSTAYLQMALAGANEPPRYPKENQE